MDKISIEIIVDKLSYTLQDSLYIDGFLPKNWKKLLEKNIVEYINNLISSQLEGIKYYFDYNNHNRILKLTCEYETKNHSIISDWYHNTRTDLIDISNMLLQKGFIACIVD